MSRCSRGNGIAGALFDWWLTEGSGRVISRCLGGGGPAGLLTDWRLLAGNGRVIGLCSGGGGIARPLPDGRLTGGLGSNGTSWGNCGKVSLQPHPKSSRTTDPFPPQGGSEAALALGLLFCVHQFLELMAVFLNSATLLRFVLRAGTGDVLRFAVGCHGGRAGGVLERSKS